MSAPSVAEVTQLLVAWSGGDNAALEKLTPLVYNELHRLARHYLKRERPGHTLQTTALVNEAYMRLVDWKNVQWQNRAHFFAVAAQIMRHVLVDFARARHYQKRGGGAFRVSLGEADNFSMGRAAELVALDEALTSLKAIDLRKSRVVEMRFFGGLSVAETAEVLQISQETVSRDWRLAKAWLLREMTGKQ